MLTREVPFKGMEGVQVAWFVVTKEEVLYACHISSYRCLNPRLHYLFVCCTYLCLVAWLVGWLVSCMVGCMVGCMFQIAWLCGWLHGWLIRLVAWFLAWLVV